MLTDELLTFLFDGQPHLLAEPMGMWLRSSRRFTAFVTSFRAKIRKKLRVTRDQETQNDLRLELETAYRLLQERTLGVEYEPEHAGPGRSPDFAVTYTTSLTFMVEVTRMRAIASSVNDVSQEGERLADAICSKLRQILPQHPNILIIGADTLKLRQTDLQSLMLRIQQRAERGDPAFWERYGFRERADFFQGYQRLSEILVRPSLPQTNEPAIVWVNPQARYPLPSKVRTALHRSQNIG